MKITYPEYTLEGSPEELAEFLDKLESMNTIEPMELSYQNPAITVTAEMVKRLREETPYLKR